MTPSLSTVCDGVLVRLECFKCSEYLRSLDIFFTHEGIGVAVNFFLWVVSERISYLEGVKKFIENRKYYGKVQVCLEKTISTDA